jgi:hypothetical protein
MAQASRLCQWLVKHNQDANAICLKNTKSLNFFLARDLGIIQPKN